MIKKRFWQRAYLLTIAFFALFLALAATLILVSARGQLLLVYDEGEAFAQIWRELWQKCLFICFSAFFVLCVVLYIIMLSLSKPLEELAFTEQRFAAGNYGIRAEYDRKDEIGRLARSFNQIAESVESSIKSLEENAELKQQLVDNLSHELRTPLTAINGYADYVWQAALSEEEIYAEMEKIKNETKRLLRISNRMLEISALRDANRRQGNKTPVNPVRVSRLFAQVESTLMPAAKSMGISLLIEKPLHEYIIQGDPAMLESLFVNLVHNSLKACEKGAKVSLACHAQADGLLVSVADTGCGMTEEQLSHLGEEFYRADKARSRKHGGAGLGVALCFQIAQAHKAQIKYNSSPGKGTEATVIFENDIFWTEKNN